ncbi:GGDEF domain-containing protein [Neorhizobium galegae]|nr:GGDEF domain-containing protein [Neorhizobium galegae]
MRTRDGGRSEQNGTGSRPAGCRPAHGEVGCERPAAQLRLFHEALLGGDAALSREVLALPAGPSQTVLDEMGLRHQLSAFVALMPVRGRDQEIKLLLELRDKMASGVTQKKGFSRVLETVARSLRQDSTAGPEDILAEIEYLSVSLSDAVVAETELEAILRSGADRLVKAEREASVARSVTLRDRLTSLPNHAALAERLEALYGVDADSRDTALFLVTVTDLPHFARTYGDPAVNRIVKKAASIFRKAIKKTISWRASARVISPSSSAMSAATACSRSPNG